MRFAYGHDYGNAETCGVVIEQGIPHSHIIPSATAHGSLADLARKRGAMGENYEHDTDALARGEYVLEMGGSQLFAGSLALSQSRTSSTARGDIHRYWSGRSLEMLLVTSAVTVPHLDYELDVVTGLPIETFTSENRKRVRDALEGEHSFILNGKRRRAIIHVTRVIMEGAGAIIAHGVAEPVPQVAIDIGGRTTDIYVAIGQKPEIGLCKGKPIGVETASDMLASRFEMAFGRPLQQRETRSLLRAYVNNTPYPAIFANNKRIAASDLQCQIEQSLHEVGREIASFVGLTLNTSEAGAIGSDMAVALLVGGGAYYFEEELRARIPGLRVPDRPECANAMGYAALASQLTRLRAIA